MGFRKAERKQVKLKLGITGPSGSGKTFSALRIAKGLLEQRQGYNYRIALIDTENKSASLYADTKGMPAFDTLELEPPYTVEKYIAAIELAIQEKYDLVVVDSVSHVWAGEGGLLQEKETLDTRGGNSFANWAKMTPKWNRFVSAILHSDVHMICTMRSKQEHALSQNDKGKTEVKKMGMAPQVRDGFEYELTAVFDMDMSHHAQASKDRTNLFDGRTWKPDEKTGCEISNWLNSGKVVENQAPKSETPPATEAPAAPSGPVIPPQAKGPVITPPASNILLARSKAIENVLNPTHWPKGSVLGFCEAKYGKKLGEITDNEFMDLVQIVGKMTHSQAKVELAKQNSEKPAAPAEDQGEFGAFQPGGPTPQPMREPGEEG